MLRGGERKAPVFKRRYAEPAVGAPVNAGVGGAVQGGEAGVRPIVQAPCRAREPFVSDEPARNATDDAANCCPQAWFDGGPESDEIVLIKVTPTTVAWWNGEDSGEIGLG